MTKARKGGKTRRRGGSRKRKGGLLAEFQRALAPYLLFQGVKMQQKKKKGGKKTRRGGRKSRRGGAAFTAQCSKRRRGADVAQEQQKRSEAKL